MRGEAVRWGLTEHLLAAAVDALNAGNWQRAGDKKARRPKPIPRPGVKTPGERRFGSGRFTIDEMQAILDRRKGG